MDELIDVANKFYVGKNEVNEVDNTTFYDVTKSPLVYIGVLSFILFAAAIYNRSRALEKLSDSTHQKEWFM